MKKPPESVEVCTTLLKNEVLKSRGASGVERSDGL